MKKVGLDLGYANVKVVTEKNRFSFPSAVGTPDQGKFDALGSSNSETVRVGENWYNVGSKAVEQSIFTGHSEERGWFSSPEYTALLYSALLQIAGDKKSITIEKLITGLPVAFYEKDKGKLKEILVGKHAIQPWNEKVVTVNCWSDAFFA